MINPRISVCKDCGLIAEGHESAYIEIHSNFERDDAFQLRSRCVDREGCLLRVALL